MCSQTMMGRGHPSDRAQQLVEETQEIMGRENLVRQAIMGGMNPQQAYLTY